MGLSQYYFHWWSFSLLMFFILAIRFVMIKWHTAVPSWTFCSATSMMLDWGWSWFLHWALLLKQCLTASWMHDGVRRIWGRIETLPHPTWIRGEKGVLVCIHRVRLQVGVPPKKGTTTVDSKIRPFWSILRRWQGSCPTARRKRFSDALDGVLLLQT